MPLHILKPSGVPGARGGDVRQALAEGAAGAQKGLRQHRRRRRTHRLTDRPGTAVTVTRSGSEVTAMTRNEDGMKGSRRLGMGGSGIAFIPAESLLRPTAPAHPIPSHEMTDNPVNQPYHDPSNSL